jgi:hypothetical protein
MASVPNMDPDQPDPTDAEPAQRHPRANPALVYRDDPHTEAVVAASARATTVSRRFGSRRRTLTRPEGDHPPGPGPSSTDRVDPGAP